MVATTNTENNKNDNTTNKTKLRFLCVDVIQILRPNMLGKVNS